MTVPNLPTGTVTFLFTDIEGSTMLLQRLGDRRYAEVLEEHQQILRTAFAKGNGHEVDTQGDAFLVAFPRARDALATAVAAQQALTKYPWQDGVSLQVRMGLHTGEPVTGTKGYVGLDVHRASRICAAGHGGQILVSQTVRDLVALDLPAGVSLRDLGLHRLKDLREPEQVLQVLHADLPTDFPVLKSLDARPNNLPRQLTSFIGREKEMGEVKRLLSNAHLVTLTGAGGAGKTRLALQVAAAVAEAYPGGVWLAEFAPIADPSLVPKTVASALNVPEQPGRDMAETLVDALRQKALLLVLDNCEHLLAACGDLVAVLLRACPGVRILATSRESLGVPGERVWRIPSLSLPEVRSALPSEDLVLYEAVRLFVDRAMATVPEFAVTRENASAIVQICGRLDGIPLAIELAAARVRVLTVEQIAARLDDRFRLLSGGSRMVLPRHQTLKGAIDWSYNLLSESEHVLLRRLSVFAGGWTLEAAESVCTGRSVDAAGILDLLTSLVDKSLVIAEPHGGETRYRLLETVRQYGRDRLAESGETAEIRGRHQEWCLRLAEAAEPALVGPEQMAWMDQLEAEHDNFRAALAWSTNEAEAAQAALRIAGLLWWFWYNRGHVREGRQWLQRALARNDNTSPAARLQALMAATFLAMVANEFERVAELGEHGLSLCHQLDDRRAMARIWVLLGATAARKGDLARATALLNDGLAVARNARDDWPFVGLALVHLGNVRRDQGDYRDAVALHTESLELSNKTGNLTLMAFNLVCLGHDTLQEHDYRWAGEHFIEGLTLSQRLRHVHRIEDCVTGLALVACGQALYDRAARLLGVADALVEVHGSQRRPRVQAAVDLGIAEARKTLGDSAFVDAWKQGKMMTSAEAIEYALGGESVDSHSGKT